MMDASMISSNGATIYAEFAGLCIGAKVDSVLLDRQNALDIYNSHFTPTDSFKHVPKVEALELLQNSSEARNFVK